MLWVLLVHPPAGQPQSPNWEAGRGEKTLTYAPFFLYVCHAPLLPSTKFKLSPADLRGGLRADTQLWVLSKESEHVASYECWDTRLLLLLSPYPAPGQKINTPAAIWSASDHRDGTGEQHKDPRPAIREEHSPPGQGEEKLAFACPWPKLRTALNNSCCMSLLLGQPHRFFTQSDLKH